MVNNKILEHIIEDGVSIENLYNMSQKIMFSFLSRCNSSEAGEWQHITSVSYLPFDFPTLSPTSELHRLVSKANLTGNEVLMGTKVAKGMCDLLLIGQFIL